MDPDIHDLLQKLGIISSGTPGTTPDPTPGVDPRLLAQPDALPGRDRPPNPAARPPRFPARTVSFRTDLRESGGPFPTGEPGPGGWGDEGLWPDKDLSMNQVLDSLVSAPFVADTLSQFGPGLREGVDEVTVRSRGTPGMMSNRVGYIRPNIDDEMNLDIGAPYYHRTLTYPDYSYEEKKPEIDRKVEQTLAHEFRHLMDQGQGVLDDMGPRRGEFSAIEFNAILDTMRDIHTNPRLQDYDTFINEATQRAVEFTNGYPGLSRDLRSTIKNRMEDLFDEVQDYGFLRDVENRPWWQKAGETLDEAARAVGDSASETLLPAMGMGIGALGGGIASLMGTAASAAGPALATLPFLGGKAALPEAIEAIKPFSPTAIDQLRAGEHDPSYGKKVLAFMHPQSFLDYAYPIVRPVESSMRRLAEATFDRDLRDLPFLKINPARPLHRAFGQRALEFQDDLRNWLAHSGREGMGTLEDWMDAGKDLWQVTGHEGRHRAHEFMRRGRDLMPVRLWFGDDTGLGMPDWLEDVLMPEFVSQEKANVIRDAPTATDRLVEQSEVARYLLKLLGANKPW